MMFNRILNEGEIPSQWEEMRIKSIYKNKGSRKELKNRRGIFITNILSKMFERVVMAEVNRTIKHEETQYGARKGRSSKDNWLVIMALIEENRRRGEATWFVFVDAVKCFDKLWLEDCLVNLSSAGIREKEVEIIGLLNKNARITVETPSGKTNELQIKKIVKQGTVFGPQLCCVGTNQINHIGSPPITAITPKVSTKAMTYVDDIAGMGRKETVEIVGRNLREMEERKKFEFNLEKTKCLKVKGTNNKEEEIPEIYLKKGKVEETSEYKYLGNYLTSSGRVTRQILEIERKAEGITKGIKNIANENDLGTMSTEARILLYKRTGIPSLTYNLEVWNDLSTAEWERLERLQAKVLKRILGLPSSTSYWGLLRETGIWTIKWQVNYQKMMLFHLIINSEDNRQAKRLLDEQEKTERNYGFYNNCKKIAETMKINIQHAKEKKKEEWKKLMKAKINTLMNIDFKIRKVQSRKIRHLAQGEKEWKSAGYIDKLGVSRATEVLRTRLEMWDIGRNFGKERKCIGCGEDETTEHVLECWEIKRKIGKLVNAQWLQSENGKELLTVTDYIKEYIEWRDELAGDSDNITKE